MTRNNNRPSWDATWLDVAFTIAKRSRCSRAQVGAVIVSKDQRISSSGYNGPSANLSLSGDCIEWCPRAQGTTPLDNTYDSCPSIHAEANALLYVDRSRVEGGTIYVTGAPCMQCAKLISNSGIARVVTVIREVDTHRSPETVIEYLKKCGVSVMTTNEGEQID
jgi:dCMP deaminase